MSRPRRAAVVAAVLLTLLVALTTAKAVFESRRTAPSVSGSVASRADLADASVAAKQVLPLEIGPASEAAAVLADHEVGVPKLVAASAASRHLVRPHMEALARQQQSARFVQAADQRLPGPSPFARGVVGFGFLGWLLACVAWIWLGHDRTGRPTAVQWRYGLAALVAFLAWSGGALWL